MKYFAQGQITTPRVRIEPATCDQESDTLSTEVSVLPETKFELAVAYKVKVYQSSSFEQIMMGPSALCCILGFKVISFWVKINKFVKVFYHIWVWWPSWSCDPDIKSKLKFPLQSMSHIQFGFDLQSSLGDNI